MPRYTLVLAAVAHLVAGHGPGGDMPPAVTAIPGKIPAGVLATDPAGAKCKAVPGDKSWPEEAVWEKAFPGLQKRGEQTNPAQPDFRLDVTSVQQVIDAVNFARENNIRLSVITSGHDALGRNNAQTGLMIALAGLRGVRVENAFTPSTSGLPSVITASAAPPAHAAGGMAGMAGMGGMAGMDGMEGHNMKRAVPVAVTFGAGHSTQSINDRIAEQNIFTLGADHGEVGVAGGWAQCGGHSPMAGQGGLGVDNVLEYQVVTADGVLKIANEVSNPDLFWALRGGCGGTFGVVVQSTIKAYPDTRITTAQWSIKSKNQDAIFAPTAFLHSKFVELSKNGVQGYYNLLPSKLSGTFHTVGELATQEFNNKTWTPVLEKLLAFPDVNADSLTVEFTNYNSYKAYYDSTWGAAEEDDDMKRLRRRSWLYGGGDENLEKRGAASMIATGGAKSRGGGRLLDATALSHPDLAAAIKAGMPKGSGSLMKGALFGEGVLRARKGDETAVHPSWRKAYATLWLGGSTAALANVATGMGAYVNEASYNQSDWKNVFWGSNYARLSQIKTKQDPNFVFYATPGINADHMVVDTAGRLCQIDASAVKQDVYPPIGDNWTNNPDS